MRTLGIVLVSLTLASAASAAVVSTTAHGAATNSLDGSIVVGDLISGQLGAEQAGDTGWHPVNTDPQDQLAAFTDDVRKDRGLYGLMNDFPGVGNPAKLVRYNLGGPHDVGRIGIMSGNGGKDGRVFSTTVIKYSTDNGTSFNTLGYFQSDPSGTLNAGPNAPWASTYVTVSDDGSLTLLAGVTHLEFDLYAVDNTGGQMRDPYDGLNPFTGIDDGLSAAIVSPEIWELDVVAVPEPVSLGLLALGGLLLSRRRR